MLPPEPPAPPAPPPAPPPLAPVLKLHTDDQLYAVYVSISVAILAALALTVWWLSLNTNAAEGLRRRLGRRPVLRAAAIDKSRSEAAYIPPIAAGLLDEWSHASRRMPAAHYHAAAAARAAAAAAAADPAAAGDSSASAAPSAAGPRGGVELMPASGGRPADAPPEFAQRSSRVRARELVAKVPAGLASTAASLKGKVPLSSLRESRAGLMSRQQRGGGSDAAGGELVCGELCGGGGSSESLPTERV